METKKREQAKNLPEVKKVQSLKLGDVPSFQTCTKERGVTMRQVIKEWKQKHVFEQRIQRKHAMKQRVNGNLKQASNKT